MRRCCLIHLKNSSTCQRDLYRSAMVRAGNAKLFVRKIAAVARHASAKLAIWKEGDQLREYRAAMVHPSW